MLHHETLAIDQKGVTGDQGGKGGIAGFAKGGADVSLAEDGPQATMLSYTVKADVGGKIAQLGARLIDSTARKLAGQFFANFGKELAGKGGAS